MKKIDEVVSSADAEHYKNLRYNMKDSKRVHIGSFVLIFSYDKSKDCISFEDYDHHDKIIAQKLEQLNKPKKRKISVVSKCLNSFLY